MTLSDQPVQALFSVCLDDAAMEAANAAAMQVPGAQFAGGFRDYITADRRPQFSPTIRNAASCVALVDFDQNAGLALETVDRVQQMFARRISVAGIARTLDAGVLLRAMRNGCTEFLTKPIVIDELVAALNRFQAVGRAHTLSPSTIGTVVAFLGAKGGVGATTLAVHLSVSLAQQHRKKVLLIDRKPQLGHVALYLGLKDTQYHFEELLRNADRLDPELLDGFLLRHRSGLHVIASPDPGVAPLDASTEAMASVMNLLRREYEHVLIDCTPALLGDQRPVLDYADEINVVTTPDIAGVRDLARLIERLSACGSVAGKLRVVINRTAIRDSITPEQIEKVVGFPISVSVPNNYFELLRAINDGEPISPHRRSEFNQALVKWANRLAGGMSSPETASPKKGFLPFLR